MTESNKSDSHGKGAENIDSLSIQPHSDFPLSLPLTEVRRQNILCGGICQVCLSLAQNRLVKGREWIWKGKQKVTSPPAMNHMIPFFLLEPLAI